MGDKICSRCKKRPVAQVHDCGSAYALGFALGEAQKLGICLGCYQGKKVEPTFRPGKNGVEVSIHDFLRLMDATI